MRVVRDDYLDVLRSCPTSMPTDIMNGPTVTAPISIRLDTDVRDILESEARTRGIGLASYLRQLATEAARDVRRARIRAESETVARHVAANPDARAFVEDWGTPASAGLK